MAPQVWFITGASSGFGYETTKHVLEKGDIAVATVRTPEKATELAELVKKYPETSAIVKLDVSKFDSIRPAFEEAIAKFGRVDVVFNNAGFALSGEAEGTPLEVARSLFDVNFWGVTLVSQEAVRVFRDVNPKTGSIGGVIFQSSSDLGLNAWPGAAYYAATKAAIISYSDSLRGEVDPEWKITISSIAFGYFYTKALGNSTVTDAHPSYGSHLPSHMIRAFAQGGRAPGGAQPSEAAEILYKLAKGDVKEIPTLLPLGVNAVGAAKIAAEARTKAAEAGDLHSKSLSVGV